QVLERRGDAVEFVLHPEAEIDRHLVVAGTRRVQAAGRRADQFGEARLDVHVDVFELLREGEGAGLDLFRNRVQPASDFFLIVGRNDARLRQHLAVGERAADILRVELAVEVYGSVDRFHDRGRTRGKTSAPHLVAGLIVTHRYNPLDQTVSEDIRTMANGKN